MPKPTKLQIYSTIDNVSIEIGSDVIKGCQLFHTISQDSTIKVNLAKNDIDHVLFLTKVFSIITDKKGRKQYISGYLGSFNVGELKSLWAAADYFKANDIVDSIRKFYGNQLISSDHEAFLTGPSPSASPEPQQLFGYFK